MPQPDVTLHLAIGIGGTDCPSDQVLAEIRDGAMRSVPLGRNARAVAVCAPRPQLGNVIFVGLWAAPGDATDAQLQQDLLATSLLRRGRTVALYFTYAAIQRVADNAWANVPKKQDSTVGFVRLSDDVIVTLAAGKVETKIRGEWKARWFPNVSFRVVITDLLDLAEPDTRPPITATTSRSVSANTIKWAVISTMISPLFGALVFWKGDAIAEGFAPPTRRSIGSTLAAQWPVESLTPIAPPGLLGKVIFIWSDLSMDANGIGTTGILSTGGRRPHVSMLGPAIIHEAPPVHAGRATYRLVAQDMRSALHIDWFVDGRQVGHAETQEVGFNPPSPDVHLVTKHLRVQATDVDGFVASAERTVHFVVMPPPGGGHF